MVVEERSTCGIPAIGGMPTARETSAAVFAHIDGGGQRTDVELVSTGGMNLHRPDIAEVDAAGRQPFQLSPPSSLT